MEEPSQAPDVPTPGPTSSCVSVDEVRSQLDRVLGSDLFASSRQPSKLLRYLVEETLAGRGEQLEAHSIAVDGLDKRQSFDPTIDTIVRSTLRRLRQRLERYYNNAGKDDPVEIRIPVRSYVPQFRRREAVQDEEAPAGTEIVSHYRIIEKIGEGGMGTVYLAKDLELERLVALKFLPKKGDRGAELGERVVREARAAAAIEHPNVCPVFELGEERGRRFIVSAYVPGEGLERKIARGPLPVIEAVGIAQQVAAGLGAAHRQAVVHCDIKPSNVIVADADSGTQTAKIIDFGIARARTFAEEAPHAPAGTLAYMSPEQVRGLTPDLRTDLWSLGVVLYEMVTGRTPFGDRKAHELRQAILEQDPEPLSRAAPSAPVELEWIVEKALAKEPDRRYQNADDLAVDLDALHRKVIAGRTKSLPAATRTGRSSQIRTWTIAASLALAIVAASVWIWLSQETAASDPVYRFTLPTEGVVRAPAISPDGRYVAYVERTQPGEPWKLIVHDLRRDERRQLSEASNISRPAWSHDGLWIAFWKAGMLLTAPLSGGDITEICPLPDGPYTGAVWSPDSRWIYFGVGQPPRLFRVRSTGGEPIPLGKDRVEVEESPPVFLGGSDENPTLLYTSRQEGQPTLVWHDFANGRRRVVHAGASHPSMAGDYLLYRPRSESWPIAPLLAAPVTGSPFQVARNRIQVHPSVAWYSVSKDGTVVFLESSPAAHRVVWSDRSGRKVADIGESEEWMDRPQVSPDGEWVALGARVRGEVDIWLHSSQRAVKRRLTAGRRSERPVGWSKKPLGLVYYETDSSSQTVLIEAWNDNAGAVEIFRHPSAIPEDLSSDGRFLLLRVLGEETLAYVQLDGAQQAAKLVPLFQPRGRSRAAEFSPNDDYVAYSSDETGTYEIYVQAFPAGRNWMVSEGGGQQVRWNPNGRELFYVQDDALISVAVRTQPTFSVGQTKVLFRNPNFQMPYDEPVYDVSPDGQRFAIIEMMKMPTTRIRVVSNFAETFGDR